MATKRTRARYIFETIYERQHPKEARTTEPDCFGSHTGKDISCRTCPAAPRCKKEKARLASKRSRSKKKETADDES